MSDQAPDELDREPRPRWRFRKKLLGAFSTDLGWKD
jgi:hypothetical protein